MNKACLIFIVCSVGFFGCSVSAPKLGVQDEQLLPCPSSPNCVTSFGDDRDMPPITYDGEPQAAYSQLIAIIKTLPRTTIIEQSSNYMRAEFRSQLFGFVDDVEFVLLENSNNQTTINFRSASRLGYSDLGANRSRMEDIKSKF
jgi:uncharacterized protein (DUF1499 family)